MPTWILQRAALPFFVGGTLLVLLLLWLRTLLWLLIVSRLVVLGHLVQYLELIIRGRDLFFVRNLLGLDSTEISLPCVFHLRGLVDGSSGCLIVLLFGVPLADILQPSR
jgi:hypothetical protein